MRTPEEVVVLPVPEDPEDPEVGRAEEGLTPPMLDELSPQLGRVSINDRQIATNHSRFMSYVLSK